MLVALVKSPALTDYDLSSVKFIFCGAAPLSTDVAEEFRRKFNVVKLCLSMTLHSCCKTICNYYVFVKLY